jgi:hypothetical protein
LGPDVKISELLWTFSRLPEDQRISLKQNPHFYFNKDLSDQPSAYDDEFKLESLKNLKPEKDSVVLVLLDRAGQIFVDYDKFSKTYGNIWRPHGAIILKGKWHSQSAESVLIVIRSSRHPRSGQSDKSEYLW